MRVDSVHSSGVSLSALEDTCRQCLFALFPPRLLERIHVDNVYLCCVSSPSAGEDTHIDV